jgi:hypothetical protein
MLAILTLLLAAGVIAVCAMVFLDPYTLLNPLPPPTPAATLAFPTASPTYRSLPATWTPGGVQQGTSEITLRPSSTLPATQTPLVMNTFTPTNTPTDTPTSTATPTNTRTITRTPTITLTPTITNTYTNTPDYVATQLSINATGIAITATCEADPNCP